MIKDFSEWHLLKSALQRQRNEVFFREREIWLCSLGLNLGHEQDGKGNLYLRPVIILKKLDENLFWSIPLTSRIKEGFGCYQFDFKDRTSTALLLQMRLLDRKRLLRKMGTMFEETFYEMARIFTELIPQNELPLGGEGVLGGRSPKPI